MATINLRKDEYEEVYKTLVDLRKRNEEVIGMCLGFISGLLHGRDAFFSELTTQTLETLVEIVRDNIKEPYLENCHELDHAVIKMIAEMGDNDKIC